MNYLIILTPVIIALVELLDAYFKADTARWRKRVIPLLIILTVVSGGYGAYDAYAARKAMQPWEAMQNLRGRVVDDYALLSKANATKDPAAIDALTNEYNLLALDAAKSQAPSWFKSHVMLFAFMTGLWAMDEKYPNMSFSDILAECAKSSSQGPIFEGHPDRLMSMLGVFRVQDFGPPYQMLLGYDAQGQLLMDTTRISDKFLFQRAHDFLTDLEGMSQ